MTSIASSLRSHLAFGLGTHHCLGAPLARRELYYGFKVLFERFDEIWFIEGENDFHYPTELLPARAQASQYRFSMQRRVTRLTRPAHDDRRKEDECLTERSAW